jgi:hypothetical protein
LRPTHDTYLKQWQLSGPHLDYDVVLYDEAQDADACVADVVSRQSHAQLVAVGDSAQAIYGWRGAGDFLATVAARHRLALTQSWRFGQAIADEANVWLGVVGSGVRVVGNPSRGSVLSKLAHPDAVLCRSNAATIDEVLAAHTTGTKVHLEGDGTEMLALARAAQRMQDGQPAERPELAAFPDWAAVQAYAENDPNGTDLAVAVRMIDGYGAGTVIEAIEGTVPAADAQLVVSTAHKSKGLEWAKIRIADDFRQPRDPKSGELLPIPKDMAMLGYVAVTRGREVLDTGGLAWVHGHLDALGQSASGCAVVTTPPIGPGSEPQAQPAGDEEPDGVAARVGELLGRVGELLGRLDELSGEAIGPLLELGADSIAVARLERSLAESREALAAVASATEKTAIMAADIVGVLHQALGEGRAHLCDQRGRPAPCWAETAPELQGLTLSETGWQGSGAQLVCLPRYGAVGVRTNDLRSLLRDAGVSWALAEESDRKLLAAVVSSGLVMDIGKRGAVATPMFKIGGQPVRLVLLSADELFPGGLSTAEGQLFGEPTQPAGAVARGQTLDEENVAGGAKHAGVLLEQEPEVTAGPGLAHEAGDPGRPDELERAGTGSRGAAPAAHKAKAPSLGRSERYTYLAAEALNLYDSAGEVIAHQDKPWAHVGQLVGAALRAAPGPQLVIAVYPGAHEELGLPARLPHDGERPRLEFARGAITAAIAVREVGGAGGLVVEAHDQPRVLVCFPGYSGEFDRAADAGQLARSLARFPKALGFGYAYSAASTVHKLIERSQGRGNLLGPPAPHPPLDPPYLPTAWSVPASAWSRPLTDAEHSRAWMVVADRSGSYLSAWRSCPLPTGSWAHEAEQVLRLGPESGRPSGYWLVEHAAVAAVVPEVMPDPFRRHGATEGLVWLTTPLVQLATELADQAGTQLVAKEAWLSSERSRPLDTPATRLADARQELMGDPAPEAAVALSVLKEGYAAATAWFENGPQPPHPLARPDWKRTVHDRFVANTWRSLGRSEIAPVGMTDVDAALFPVDEPGLPAGLKAGTGLGSWKLKGRVLEMGEALRALEAGGPAAVVAMAEPS